ncbi:MAG: DUF4956 domain-containing protein [Chloroflexota bacterium]
MEELLNLASFSPLSLTSLAINLLLSIILSSVVSWYYINYGKSLSNRVKLARILPVLALIIVLIISIVKTSLALSLGLVGALSIVRFRTAIKEPEELVYLFLTIAIGLGLGADQRWPTVVAVGIIMGFLLVQHLLSPKTTRNNLYFNISISKSDGAFKKIDAFLKAQGAAVDLRRVDQIGDSLHATYLINQANSDTVSNLMDGLSDSFPQSEFSFVEQDNSLAG